MPRISRIFTKEGVFHILSRGNNRQKVFRDIDDYTAYLNLLKKYKQEHRFRLYHYCLMPNHVHLIIESTKDTDLSRLMKQLNIAYLCHYRKRYGYCGHFWQDRYKSLLISKDEYLITAGRYIELNPVKAKIVSQPKDYAWSSYNAYAYGKKDGLTDYSPIYLEMGATDMERQKNYRKDILKESKTAALNLNVRFFGSKEFISQMEEEFQVKNTQARRGRPKRDNKHSI
ncbi:MAG: transposase [Candidatus Omnitrophica bacterium CG12_big_fil_rev_8_21_14_0_65_43_15]|uniref:Transposase n=1 Tax=Candidatus Taenaricola geysiri TaxID=1974752 RepID=A0A2J0LGK4_9BACT|nr:MAG: transposase [Candidatus Omnitrophica bacterium CG10_big_fil_rev_8_21_14_0_10_43_8]PIV12379.1 MAG: transposase [Candidatus Omnitrophica bacterium CG03_land_8_20_14_0_80_43_22]PIW66982.1 MAG: transposase [Candidatus Omnitrophica bacterium CG12_big_fil_rev_8_21_14_0_65_43_15]